MAKDVELFRAAMAGVTPLKPARQPAVARPKADGALPVQERSLPGVGVTAKPVVTPSRPPQTFDRDVDRALAKGKRTPQAKLDLHGMTLVAAERAVAHFIADAWDRDLRVALVVTGKGLRLEGGRVFGGRIRAEFEGWLDRPENRARVAGVRPAHARHGGSGAFYVLLRRRQRSSPPPG